MPATITMSMPEWQEKQTQIDELTAKLEATQAALEAARLGGTEGETARIVQAFRLAMPLVQFAIANYHPRMFPGWPHAELEALAGMLPELPGIDEQLREVSGDLRLFARQAGEWEKARQDGTLEEMFLEENAGGLSLPDELYLGATGLIKPGT